MKQQKGPRKMRHSVIYGVVEVYRGLSDGVGHTVTNVTSCKQTSVGRLLFRGTKNKRSSIKVTLDETSNSALVLV